MTDRTRRYASKISGKTIGSRYDAVKSEMIKHHAPATEKLVKIENQVKTLCTGESTILLPYYIIFAKEINKKARKMEAQALLNEVVILEKKWESRGLASPLLEKIKELYVEAYKPAPVLTCRFDVGRFDVNTFG